MLNRKYRLKNNSAFTATYRVKNSYYLNGVAVFVGLPKSDEAFYTKAGFVVSKKTHKRAVKRNRVKRLMRESYRLLMKENKLGISQKYMSLIFIGHANSLNLDFAGMKKTIEELLNKIHD